MTPDIAGSVSNIRENVWKNVSTFSRNIIYHYGWLALQALLN